MAKYFRGGTKREVAQFKRLQKAAFDLGFTTDLPKTKTAFKRAYTGSKVFAESDYYYEWYKEITAYLDKVIAKANRKAKKEGINRDFPKRVIYKDNVDMYTVMVRYVDRFRSIGGFLDPNYTKSKMNKSEISKLNQTVKKGKDYVTILPKEKDDFLDTFSAFNPKFLEKDNNGNLVYEVPLIMEAGVVAKPGTNLTRKKDFGGSQYKMAYNNFLVGLSNLGYVYSLTYMKNNLSVEDFIRIFDANKTDLELVYKYRTAKVDSDMAILQILMQIEPQKFQVPDELNKDKLTPVERAKLIKLRAEYDKREKEKSRKRRLLDNMSDSMEIEDNI